MSPLIELTSALAAIRETKAASPLFTLLVLTEQAETEALCSQLDQLPEVVEQIERYASASELRRFTEWALQQSYSPRLTLDEKLQLLDTAWKVQKLLWLT
jgi:hypothetical protein